MTKMVDPQSGLLITDSEQPWILNEKDCSLQSLAKATENLIISASGWRKIFAKDGESESQSPEITSTDKLLCALMSEAFISYLREKKNLAPQQKPCLVIGLDSRDTGPCIAEAIIRNLLDQAELKYIFISAAPEIMSYTKSDGQADGFIYVSASHNPRGYNGIKFGFKSGGVLDKSEAVSLGKDFLELIKNPDTIKEVRDRLIFTDLSRLNKIFESVSRFKTEALEKYEEFSRRVVSHQDQPESQDRFFSDLAEGLQKRPLGIIGELNGSARALSIDRAFFSKAGLKTAFYNDKPRQIVHRIVPEGASLDLAKQLLEEKYQQDSDFLFGYVPDNDGDRGNIVYIDKKNAKAQILEAQQVFALCCLSELASLYYQGMLKFDSQGNSKQKTAVVVNGPTSLRVEEIAEAFGARVFRAEVGEANVVNLAAELRGQGYLVRILGEGSNGGNITWPAAVRDPLNTVFALLKLLVLDSDQQREGLFALWCRLSDQEEKYSAACGLSEIINSLPAYSTTSAFEEEAKLQIKSSSQAALKKSFEELFLKEWEEKKNWLDKDFGITSWQEINYEGLQENKGLGPDFRSGKETGGLKILFFDKKNKPRAFIWMRGSQTEPVFRVMADLRGNNPAGEKALLNWMRQMVEKADKA